MIAQELRELPDDELRQKLADGKEELFNLRFQVVTGQLDNPRRLREVRREIARVLTVMKEREIAQEQLVAVSARSETESDAGIGEELATADSTTDSAPDGSDA